MNLHLVSHQNESEKIMSEFFIFGWIYPLILIVKKSNALESTEINNCDDVVMLSQLGLLRGSLCFRDIELHQTSKQLELFVWNML